MTFFTFTLCLLAVAVSSADANLPFSETLEFEMPGARHDADGSFLYFKTAPDKLTGFFSESIEDGSRYWFFHREDHDAPWGAPKIITLPKGDVTAGWLEYGGNWYYKFSDASPIAIGIRDCQLSVIESYAPISVPWSEAQGKNSNDAGIRYRQAERLLREREPKHHAHSLVGFFDDHLIYAEDGPRRGDRSRITLLRLSDGKKYEVMTFDGKPLNPPMGYMGYSYFSLTPDGKYLIGILTIGLDSEHSHPDSIQMFTLTGEYVGELFRSRRSYPTMCTWFQWVDDWLICNSKERVIFRRYTPNRHEEE